MVHGERTKLIIIINCHLLRHIGESNVLPCIDELTVVAAFGLLGDPNSSKSSVAVADPAAVAAVPDDGAEEGYNSSTGIFSPFCGNKIYIKNSLATRMTVGTTQLTFSAARVLSNESFTRKHNANISSSSKP
jgi:hypothetical protein